MDPQTLCRLATSCEEARQIDATHYEGTVRARLGFASVRANVRGEVLETDEPHFMKVALQGETVGLPGSFRGMAQLSMAEDHGETRARYSFDVSILGRLGALGKPFFQALGKRMANSFAGKVSRHLKKASVPEGD